MIKAFVDSRASAVRLVIVAALLAGLACLLASASVQSASADEPADEASLEALHADFLTGEDLQLEWPVAEPTELPQEESPGWLRAIGQFIGGLIQALGPVFRVLFYLACALGVGSILWFIARSMMGSRFPFQKRADRTRPEDSVMAPYRPDSAVARSLLDEADALAAAGRFAEAVHLLLFRSIEDIQARRHDGVPRSLTAREIADLESLPQRARKGLEPIIQLVERSFFGGRSVDHAGWTKARSSYEAFAFGEAWT